MFKMIDTIPNNKKLILFDGVCNLCNEAVLKIIKQDKRNIFLFTALNRIKETFFYLQHFNQIPVKILLMN